MAAFEAVLSLRWISQTTARGEAKISLPKWAPYDSEARRILELGDEIRSANGEWVELCGLIAGYR